MRVIYSHSPEHCLVSVHCGSILSHYCRILFKKNNKAEFQFFLTYLTIVQLAFFPFLTSFTSSYLKAQKAAEHLPCGIFSFASIIQREMERVALVKQSTWNGCSRGAASAGAMWVLLRVFSALQAVPEHCAEACMRGSLRSVTGYLFFVGKIPGCFMYLPSIDPSRFSCLIFGIVQMKHLKLAVFEGITHCLLMTEIAIMWANPNQREKYD